MRAEWRRSVDEGLPAPERIASDVQHGAGPKPGPCRPYHGADPAPKALGPVSSPALTNG
jgi:hypothetical protein